MTIETVTIERELEELKRKEKLMRRLLEFYAQDNLRDGCSGYDQVFDTKTCTTIHQGSVIEDAGRKASLLLLDLYGDTGLWKDEATAREKLQGVSYTDFDEENWDNVYSVTIVDRDGEWFETMVFKSRDDVMEFINKKIDELNKHEDQKIKHMRWPGADRWTRELDGWQYVVRSHEGFE